MTYDITTYEEARARVDQAEKDMRGDYPNVADVDIGHEACTCVIGGGAGTIDPAVAIELARRQLGWDPKHDADLFKQHGIDSTTTKEPTS